MLHITVLRQFCKCVSWIFVVVIHLSRLFSFQSFGPNTYFNTEPTVRLLLKKSYPITKGGTPEGVPSKLPSQARCSKTCLRCPLSLSYTSVKASSIEVPYKALANYANYDMYATSILPYRGPLKVAWDLNQDPCLNDTCSSQENNRIIKGLTYASLKKTI